MRTLFRCATNILVDHLPIVFGRERGSNSLQPFLAKEIEFTIHKIAPYKALGDDHLIGAILKLIAKLLLVILSNLFKLC